MQKKLSGSSWARPPRRDEVEVCLFGPGFGECSLIHVGGGQWIVIDSCIDAATGDPAAISYLASIGYSPQDHIALIIATHWHDDHIRGLGELVRRSPNAKFCCSTAFRRDEFQSMLEAMNQAPSTLAGSGVREMYDVTRTIIGRDQTVTFAAPNRPIKVFDPADTGHGQPARVTTLSPSDKQITNFFAALSHAVLGSPRIEPVGPNHLTVVTLVEIGDMGVLLGGDLEETSDPQTGWSAIVNSKERPQKKAAIFKIPHHGSGNAHSEEVWAQLLLSDPLAALTPFNRGHKLPTPADVNRIASKTNFAFISASMDLSRSSKRRSTSVEHQLRAMNTKLTRLEPRTGAVRFRGDPSAPHTSWVIELRDDARPLSVHAA